MNKCKKKKAVIRFHKYNKDAEPSNWYRAKLMLYYPWYNEQRDLLGGYTTYAEHYQHVQSIEMAAKCKLEFSDCSKVESEVTNADIHGMVTSLSPIKEATIT